MNDANWRYFKHSEFACKCGECGSDGSEMDEEFVSRIDGMRQLAGFPFIVTSGYRCPDYNEKISTTGRDGPHTTGRAIDIGVSGENAHLLVRWAALLGMTGIGLNQKGPHKGRFVHLDNLSSPHPRPRIWTY